MSDEGIHRAVSADGTEIAGQMRGEGPPLVLVHPPVVDAEIAWEALLPHLTGRFTCYVPSLRGRGLSGDNPDHSPPRLQEDFDAFAESIGGPVCLVGWSDSASMALGTAATSDAVVAVGAFEPSVWPLMREDELARQGAMVEEVGAAVADGRLVDAARTFHQYVCNEDEFDALDVDYLERQGGIWPLLLQEVQQGMAYEGPEPTDAEVLAQIDAPVLALLGQQTRLDTWFTDSAQHVAQHVADAHVRELPGVGHFAPLIAPEPVAKEVISFFESALQPT